MEINVKKPSGTVNINANHVINYIYDQVITVPGVSSIGKRGFLSKIKNILHAYTDDIKLISLGVGSIGVEIHIILTLGVNFKTIASQIQERVMFSVEQKFGINVNFVDVIIEGTE